MDSSLPHLDGVEADSASSGATADLLSLSVETVQSHRAAAMQKPSLREVTHVARYTVRYTVRKGIVDSEDSWGCAQR
jgi:hypothetical protein